MISVSFTGRLVRMARESGTAPSGLWAGSTMKRS